jgi:hypothetical protein
LDFRALKLIAIELNASYLIKKMKLRTKSKNEPILKLLKFQHVGEFVKNEPILKLLMWVNLFVLPAPSPIKKTRFQKCA